MALETIPDKCPTCSTAIPQGAARCPGCGRVFGEDNRCPHCHAIAAVKPAGSGFACLACGKPRDRLPHTSVLGEPDARMSLTPPPSARAGNGPLGTLGTGIALAGTAAAATSFALFGTGALFFAVFALVVGLGAGAALVSAGRSRKRAAEKASHRALEQRILDLAAKRSGHLRAGDVADAFRISSATAEAALMRMSDGSKITAEVDESVGALDFVFHDLVPAPPRTRVEVPGDDASESEEASESVSEKKRRRVE